MTSVCQQVITLASPGYTKLGECTPDAAISAVSRLANEHTRTKENVMSLTQELEEVSKHDTGNRS